MPKIRPIRPLCAHSELLSRIQVSFTFSPLPLLLPDQMPNSSSTSTSSVPAHSSICPHLLAEVVQYAKNGHLPNHQVPFKTDNSSMFWVIHKPARIYLNDQGVLVQSVRTPVPYYLKGLALSLVVVLLNLVIGPHMIPLVISIAGCLYILGLTFYYLPKAKSSIFVPLTNPSVIPGLRASLHNLKNEALSNIQKAMEIRNNPPHSLGAI